MSATVDGVAMVDPRAPRFGQTVTALAMVAFLLTGSPWPLFAVAAVLTVSVLSRWRLDLYGVIWRRVAMLAVGAPDELEPASPHRFAKLMGATFSLSASVLWLAGAPTAAALVALVVAVFAGVAAVFDLCVGCRMYRSVRFFRSLGLV